MIKQTDNSGLCVFRDTTSGWGLANNGTRCGRITFANDTWRWNGSWNGYSDVVVHGAIDVWGNGSHSWMTAGMMSFYVNDYNSGPTEIFRLNGDNRQTQSANGSIYSFSDSRVKENVNDLDDSLDLLKQLRPVTFQYKGKDGMHSPLTRKLETKDSDGYWETEEYQPVQYGFIADEILPIAPQYVEVSDGQIGEDEDGEPIRVDDFLTMSLTELIPMMVNSIKELSAEINNLQSQISGSSDFNALKTAVSGSS